MSDILQSLERLAIPVRLSASIRETAREFSLQLVSPDKQQQVYKNTLAVCAVNNYLKMIAVTTDLEASDSWNRAIRLVDDVADLRILGVGNLECRVLDADESSCSIPPEARVDRLGCIVVRLDREETEATLLGFYPAARHDSLPPRIELIELQTIDDFVIFLEQKESQKLVRLIGWLIDKYESGWQSGLPKTATRFLKPQKEPSRTAWKEFVFGGRSINLVLEFIQHSAEDFYIILDVSPSSSDSTDSTYLPQSLQINVTDEGGTSMEGKVGDGELYMQLPFSAKLKEKFTVELVLGNDYIAEQFEV